MKEHQIPMNAAMVRATLESRKVQTRRIVKQELRRLGDGDWYEFDHKGINYRVNARHTTVGAWANLLQFCPYGQRGDRLWVREAWRTVNGADDIPPRNLMNVEQFTTYEADNPKPPGMGKLRPSMFMPRWASRINLEITNVRVERLKDCSEDDAMSEGCEKDLDLYWFDGVGTKNKTGRLFAYDAHEAFSWLWESINGPGSWEANPWVWVIEFKRMLP